MSNRSYLYSLSSQPTSFADRPVTLSGLSEWVYDVPFLYRLLMSADPQLCASLVADGLDGEESGPKTRLHAISSPFDPGLERAIRFAEIVKVLVTKEHPLAAAESAAAEPGSFQEMRGTTSWTARLKRLFSSGPDSVALPTPTPTPPPPPAVAARPASGHLPSWFDEMLAFLDKFRDNYLLLETVELDTMYENGESALRACAEAQIARCRHVGAAFEALPSNTAEAAAVLRRAAAERCAAPLDAFFGLRFDDACDSTRTLATEHPLGLTRWSTVLYFRLADKAAFEAGETGN